MGYDSGDAPVVLWDGPFFVGFVMDPLVLMQLNNCPTCSCVCSSSIGQSPQTRKPEEWAGVEIESWWLHQAPYRAPYVTRNLQ